MLRASATPGASGPPLPDIHPLDFDFEVEPEVPRYIVDGLIEPKGVTVISGDTGTGKSILALSLALELCRGSGEWLGRRADHCRVLYIDEENSAALVRSRLRALGMTNEHRDTLAYYCRTGFTIGEERWNEKLRSAVREHGPGVVFIDTAMAASNARVNENDDVVALYKFLRQLAEEFDLAVIMLHHERKDAVGGRRA